MLERLREGSQGLAAKIIIGAIILSFALFGIGNYITGSTQQNAAEVNDQAITMQDLDQAFQRQRSQMQQQYGKAFDQYASDPAFIANMKQNVLQTLISQALLDQQAAKLGLRVGDEELKAAIRDIPAFQVDEKFNNEKYLALLQQNRLTPLGFRDTMRQEMTRLQLIEAISGSDFGLPYEAAIVKQLRDQKREMQFVSIPATKFESGITSTPEELQAHYELKKADYQLPETVKVEYLKLDINTLMDKVQVSDEQAQQQYNDNIALYTVAAKANVAQIQINIEDNDVEAQSKAQAALDKLNAGAEFAEVAKTDSQDLFSAANGGQLSNYSATSVDPAFAKAVESLDVGQLSGIVKTEKSLHIIKLLSVEPEYVKAFDEVKSVIITQLKNKQANEDYYELLEELKILVHEKPKALDEIAKVLELNMDVTGSFSRASAPKALQNPMILNKVFDPEMILDGKNSDVFDTAPQSSMVVRVIGHVESSIEPFEAVEAKVKQDYIATQAKIAADKFAVEVKQKLIAGEDVSTELSQHELALSDPQLVERFSRELDPALMQALFSMPKPAEGERSVENTLLASGEQAIVVLLNVVEAPVTESTDDKAGIAMLSQSHASAAERAVLAHLRTLATIRYFTAEAQ